MPKVNIHAERRGNVVVIHASGRVDSATAPVFEHALMSALDDGGYQLVVDFAGVDYISSAGLRGLLVAGKRMRTLPNGKLVLCSLREQIRDVFEISGFLGIFSVTASLDAAIAQFS